MNCIPERKQKLTKKSSSTEIYLNKIYYHLPPEEPNYEIAFWEHYFIGVLPILIFLK